jgi:hypothetical protein
LLKLFHPQAYVLLRNPRGEQGSLGYQQLQEAYGKTISSGQGVPVQLQATKIELITPQRVKVWGDLITKPQKNNQALNLPAYFEADLVHDKGAWLITDAIIQYDEAP